MKKISIFLLTIGVLVLIGAVLPVGNASATIKLYDDKLILSGFVKETAYVRSTLSDEEEKFRNNQCDLLKTSAYIEALYSFKDTRGSSIKLFTGFKWWYEAAPALDDKLRHYIPHNDRSDYVSPRSFEEDVLTEAYLDVIEGPWDVRVGKQIVIWGQLDVQRVADVVNPMDFRWGVPGIDTWEEVKKGLWMIRTTYQTQLPGNLIFEGIFNPGYFQQLRLPYEGTHWGSSYPVSNQFQPAQGPGYTHYMEDKWQKDTGSHWSLHENYEFGLRVQGYTWDIDWTLLMWNARDDGPVANPRRVTPWFYNYLVPAILASTNGSVQKTGAQPDYDVFYYKRFTTIGGTAQTTFPALHNSIWRLEWFSELSKPMNLGTNGDKGSINGWTRKNTAGFAICYIDKFTIPWLTHSKICTDSQFQMTLTYSFDKIFNFDNDLVVDQVYHRRGESTADSFSLWFMQAMFNQELSLIFIGSYYPRIGKIMACPTLSYMFPGKHWRAELGYVGYASRSGYTKGSYYDKDSMIMRLRYEF
jgi:hypothetical protein